MTEVWDDVGKALLSEHSVLLTSDVEYIAMFGHRPPAEIEFSKSWVAFYSAGTFWGAYEQASIVDVSFIDAAHSLVISTLLRYPGVDCPMLGIPIKPYMMVAFPKPDRDVSVVRFNKSYDQLICDGGGG